MKRFIPLLFTCLIVLTSMSDCNKLLTELKSLEKLTVSAEINGSKFSGNTYDNDKVESDLVSVSWADSVAYILSADMTKEGQDITSAPVYYVVLRISMKVKGDLKLDKWYPLDIDNDYIYDVDANQHRITEGMMKIKKNKKGRYEGEFWFNSESTYERSENKNLTVTKGKFKNYRIEAH